MNQPRCVLVIYEQVMQRYLFIEGIYFIYWRYLFIDSFCRLRSCWNCLPSCRWIKSKTLLNDMMWVFKESITLNIAMRVFLWFVSEFFILKIFNFECSYKSVFSVLIYFFFFFFFFFFQEDRGAQTAQKILAKHVTKLVHGGETSFFSSVHFLIDWISCFITFITGAQIL